MRGGASEKERDGQREREARLMEVAQPPPRPFKHIEYLEGLQVVTLKLEKSNLSLSLSLSLALSLSLSLSLSSNDRLEGPMADLVHVRQRHYQRRQDQAVLQPETYVSRRQECFATAPKLRARSRTPST